MTLLHIDAVGEDWRPNPRSACDLAAALARIPPTLPVPILIHGFRYAPGVRGKDPHDQILSPVGQAGRGLPSWPRHLGLREDDPQLMIAFGWQAGGTLWAARNQAVRAGVALSHLIRTIHQLRPGQPVSIMAHSLGARVFLGALETLPERSIWRAVLLYPAAFRYETEHALAFPAGRTCEIVNVTSGENHLFDLCHTMLTSGVLGRPVGRGLSRARPGWLDLPIDCNETLTGLAHLGFRIGRRERRVCHWSSYLRPGIFALYEALIAVPDAISLARLERACQQRSYRQAP